MKYSRKIEEPRFPICFLDFETPQRWFLVVVRLADGLTVRTDVSTFNPMADLVETKEERDAANRAIKDKVSKMNFDELFDKTGR